MPGAFEELGNVDRSADGVTGIVIPEEGLGETAHVVDEGVGVEAVVAVVPVAAAVELVGAALGHEGDLAADAASVLRLIAAGEDLEFGDGIRAHADVHAAIVAGVHVADAVDGELILRGAGAVHREGVGSGAGAADGIAGAGGEGHAGNQLRHVQGIAAVDFDVFNLFALNGGRAFHAFGLQKHGRGGNFDGVGDRADIEHEIADGQFVVGVERDAGTSQLLKSGGFDGDGVVAGKQAGHGEISSGGGLLRGGNTFRRFGYGNGGIRNGSSLLVNHAARHGAGNVLRVSRKRKREHGG